MNIHEQAKQVIRNSFPIVYRIEDGVIGYGRDLRVKPLSVEETQELIECGIDTLTGKITYGFAELLLQNDINAAQQPVNKLFVRNIDAFRRFTLLCLCMSVGIKAIQKERQFINDINRQDWELASTHGILIEAAARHPNSMKYPAMIRGDITTVDSYTLNNLL